MRRVLTILCVHGVGDHRHSTWKRDWSDALQRSVPVANVGEVKVEFVEYDGLFADVDLTLQQCMAALRKLIGSGISSRLSWEVWEARCGAARAEDLFERGGDRLRWTAGYVVAWMENDEFRNTTRSLLWRRIAETKPDVILAHSLGSLVAYEAIVSAGVASRRSTGARLKDLTFVSCGSQIGNPFVRANLLSGRVLPLPIQFWFHVYNPHDDVFTARVELPGVANFRQITVPIRHNRWPHHEAVDYIDDGTTVLNVWAPITESYTGKSTERFGGRRLVEYPSPRLAARRRGRKPRKKCLLVGISEYPQAANCLSGCVNDVFLMSSLLQELGFDSTDIRTVLNDRATTQGILSRMQWLVDDSQPEDRLVFYYSGHGARLPGYNEDELVDHMDETLVPCDFNWTPDTSIADNQICGLYSQLHYDTRLTMIFDCCHSGGMHRQGSPRVKGIDPPDDIRHRAMRWDAQHQMWLPRDFTSRAESFAKSTADAVEYVGDCGCVHRLGRAVPLRAANAKEYAATKRLARRLKDVDTRNTVPYGPYLPTILEACAENEYAYEYRHGVESYGAFTFILAKSIREHLRTKPSAMPTVDTLIGQIARELLDIGFRQRPAWLGPATKKKHFLA